MNWKKYMTLVIVSIFVLSSVSVFNTSTKAQDEFIDSITIEVRTNKTAAIDDVANGDLDVFLSPISGEFYENINESWKEKMDTWRSIARYNTMLFNPAHTVSPYECNVSGEYLFNPFTIKEIRKAQNFLVNREKIVEEMYDGFGDPRYLWVAQGGPGYYGYFEEIIDQRGYTPSGNKEKGIQMIQDAMEEANNSDELEGELRKGEDGYWEYRSPRGSWEYIELTGLIGSTDESTAISEYQAGLLEECGFKVDIRYYQSGINYLYDTDPADLKWHFYPGTWRPSGARYYQETLATMMYAGWRGYMPGGSVPDADYRYGYEIDGNFYGNRTLERVTKELYDGRVTDIDEYWNKLVKTAELGLDQSVRIFLVSEYNFYPYDKDRVCHASTDVLTGWSDVFTPRTVRTTDGTLTLAQYSSQNVLYRESWNELGGSSDINGKRQKKMLMDQGSFIGPSNGKPRPMRTDWTESGLDTKIEKDYSWEDETLQKGIDVPSDAVIYNSSSNQWEDVGEDKKSAVKVKYDIVTGKWHSDANLTLRYVMGWHAWSWDMAFEDGADDPYYHREFGRRKRSFFNNIVGEKWDEDNQTYTIWGDYTFPADSKIGHYYSIWPAVPYYQYQAAQFLVNQDDEYIPDGTGTYSWNEHEADHWIDWLSKDQGENITETLQNMIDKDYTPWFMKEENNAPIPVTQEELNEEMQHLIDFYNEHNHIFASNGPFLLDNYDDENHKM
ncbi:MAG: ABC transporter substrate-binding protein [Candidatus Saliniplasma sp.]